ncbi:hypothetical protein EAH84_08335 [Sphingomonas oligophenolica]|uniref:DUF3551 domain-containing protein n=1 Tax=Sphingomonas oligophenolica TaxID=301154 RepID=A0A502CIX6_9SPHN|nr:hypothetical protein EAH84_08335 [Sphingomonas oligophenolica]
MLRRLRLVLFAIAAFGLFGQSTAMAMAPAGGVSAPMAGMAGMTCADMPAPRSPKAPCKGMTLQCIAQMGCTAPAVLEPTTVSPREPIRSGYLHHSTQAAPLIGRADAPFPDPPTLLI